MSGSYWQRRLNKNLSAAIYFGRLDEVKALVGKGADIERADGHFADTPYNKTKGKHYGSPLFGAVEKGSAPIVEFLLSRGADPNAAMYGSTCALIKAAENGQAAIAALLLEKGAQVEAKRWDGPTALLIAAEKGAGDVIETLVTAGADVGVKQEGGVTALHLAAEKGFANIVRFLLDHGADPHARNSNLNTPADVAEKDYPRIADMIREKGALVPEVAANTAVRQVTDAPEAVADVPGAGWTLTPPDEVARVAERPAIGYRLTEIFNFETSTYTRLAQNAKTGAESQAVRFFDEFPDRAALVSARAALVALGGSAPEDQAIKPLDKPALSARPPGGPK